MIKINIKNLKKNKKYIIAVSGGPDSMFLLDNIYNQKKNIKNFIVCLVNYQKRKNSNYDEQIVIEYCQKRNIKLYVKKVIEIEYKKYMYNSNNFQTIARNLRYDFFLQIGEKNNCYCVLIAHNLNDHIETYILQKKRNSIVEYYGLNKNSYYFSYLLGKKIKLLRIMLKISREKIIKYLFNNKIDYAIDPTNISTIYDRNIIRNNIKYYNLKYILSKIKEKNKKNKKLKLITKKYFKKNFGKIVTYNFNILNIELKKIIIFNFFKKNKFIHLINNKKKIF